MLGLKLNHVGNSGPRLVFYLQRLAKPVKVVEKRWYHPKLWHVITYTCPNVTGVQIKPTLKLRYEEKP